MSNFFCEKFAKNVKTGLILANFGFFCQVFSEKSRKVSNSREKLPKMVESDFILTKCAFFVKFFGDQNGGEEEGCCLIVARGPVPRDLSGV